MFFFLFFSDNKIEILSNLNNERENEKKSIININKNSTNDICGNDKESSSVINESNLLGKFFFKYFLQIKRKIFLFKL